MSDLLRSLDNLAAQRGATASKPEDHCSFCGIGQPGNLVVGPAVQICGECATIAVGMFLVAFRDNLSLSKAYKTIFSRAVNDYARFEGEMPRIAKQPPARSPQVKHD